jgi:alkanesulfonate monooxygenase SsuD/methylene tetrahydromethanopterin reductase-like flavin-dependent oxidoreductase (luciferase family)
MVPGSLTLPGPASPGELEKIPMPGGSMTPIGSGYEDEISTLLPGPGNPDPPVTERVLPWHIYEEFREGLDVLEGKITELSKPLPAVVTEPKPPAVKPPAPKVPEPASPTIGPEPAIKTNLPPKKQSGIPWWNLLGLAVPVAAGAAGVGLPWAVVARRAAKLAKRLRVARANAASTAPMGDETSKRPGVPVVIRDDPKPATPTVVRSREFVEVEVPQRRLKALQMAHDEYVRRYPGARTTIETIENYADQFESGLPNP